MKFNVKTSADVHPCTTWPFSEQYLPRIGESIESSNGVKFKVCDVTHKSNDRGFHVIEIEVTPWFGARTAFSFDPNTGKYLESRHD